MVVVVVQGRKMKIPTFDNAACKAEYNENTGIITLTFKESGQREHFIIDDWLALEDAMVEAWLE